MQDGTGSGTFCTSACCRRRRRRQRCRCPSRARGAVVQLRLPPRLAAPLKRQRPPRWLAQLAQPGLPPRRCSAKRAARRCPPTEGTPSSSSAWILIVHCTPRRCADGLKAACSFGLRTSVSEREGMRQQNRGALLSTAWQHGQLLHAINLFPAWGHFSVSAKNSLVV